MLWIFAAALLLNLITEWNLNLASRQRLAQQENEAGLVFLRAIPARPPDALNAATIYEPTLKRIEATFEESFQPAWIDFDHPLGTDDSQTRDFLAQYQGELDQLHRAGGRAICYFEGASLVRHSFEAEATPGYD